MEGLKNTGSHDVEISKREEILLIKKYCGLTTKLIKSPGLIKLDNQKTLLIDRDELSEQIGKGFTFNDLKNPSKENIFMTAGVEEVFDRLKENQIDNPEIETIFWMGEKVKPI